MKLGFHIRAKPSNTIPHVTSRKYDLPAVKVLLLAARKRVQIFPIVICSPALFIKAYTYNTSLCFCEIRLHCCIWIPYAVLFCGLSNILLIFLPFPVPLIAAGRLIRNGHLYKSRFNGRIKIVFAKRFF